MPISVTCPQCGTTLKVKDELAGKRGKCPRCQGAVQIPAGERTEAKAPAGVARNSTAKVEFTASPEERRAGVLAPLTGSIEKLQSPFSFRMRMLLAAMATCLVPVLYLALILLFGGGAIAWYLFAPSLLGNSAGFGGDMLFYGPIAIGLVIAVSLLKPLVAPRPTKGKTKSLPRDKAPLLYEFVERVAAAIGADAPQQIAVDGNTALYGSKSRLLIGLPLVASVTAEQLAGMIAHECGRHVQGTAAGTAGFVRGISTFFFRAVKERDAWDESVHAATTSRRSWLGKLLWPIRALFMLVKVLLWPLMYLSRMFSGLLLQKTEYDADLCQIRLIGSKPFEATFRALRVMDFAWQQVQVDLVFQHKESQLPDNLPRQLESAIAQVPDDFRVGLSVQGDTSETADFALIPAEKDRLAAAHSAAAVGIYVCPLPATILFKDFDALAKDITWDYYLVELGPPLERRFLHPVV
ncbi:MAG: hypothetical protein IAF94_26085 [Pirellulaceae bacterium]|nr:hypothetical protein [Pirellulaceae bacterium]